jgi:hypothetical protein
MLVKRPQGALLLFHYSGTRPEARHFARFRFCPGEASTGSDEESGKDWDELEDEAAAADEEESEEEEPTGKSASGSGSKSKHKGRQGQDWNKFSGPEENVVLGGAFQFNDRLPT